jgi:hypothetical protein
MVRLLLLLLLLWLASKMKTQTQRTTHWVVCLCVSRAVAVREHKGEMCERTREMRRAKDPSAAHRRVCATD